MKYTVRVELVITESEFAYMEVSAENEAEAIEKAKEAYKRGDEPTEEWRGDRLSSYIDDAHCMDWDVQTVKD